MKFYGAVSAMFLVLGCLVDGWNCSLPRRADDFIFEMSEIGAVRWKERREFDGRKSRSGRYPRAVRDQKKLAAVDAGPT